jgi:hypothetical protein
MIDHQIEYLPFIKNLESNDSENITNDKIDNKYFNLEKLKFVTICVTSGTALGAVAGWIVGDVLLGMQFSFICSSFFSMLR